MIGEMSRPPRLGMIERIGASTGSVIRIQELRHRRHELVARVDDVEGDQPGQDRRGNQQPDIEIENDENDVENGTHGWDCSRGSVADSTGCKYRFTPLQTREVPGKNTAENGDFRRS